MERQTLYTKERATLEYIKEFMDRHHIAPSLEEIREKLQKKSLATVHKSLGQLESKGYIKRNHSHNRSIALTEQALEYFSTKTRNSLPLMGMVKAGPAGIQNFGEVREHIEVPASIIQDGRYVLKVEGDSMIDAYINEDDYVVVEKVADVPVNHIVVAQLNGSAYIKRLIRRSTGQLILRSENPDYDDIFIKDGDELTIEGKVVQVIRNYA